jgi:hypothetical protein
MLKHLAILTVLTAALSPMPGKAVESSAQGGDKTKSHGQGNQTPAALAPTLVNKPVQPGAFDEHGGTVAAEDKEHSVKLTSLPPVTIADKQKTFSDHAFDWGPWVFNFGLLVVGAGQAVLLWKTWKKIGKQAELMEEQAGHMAGQLEQMGKQTEILVKSVAAAELSAKAAEAEIRLMKSKERARLDIKTERVEVENPGETFWNLKTRLECRNLGPSRAYITRSSGVLIVIREDAQESTDEYEIDSPLSLPDSFLDPTSSDIGIPFWYWPPHDDGALDMKVFAEEFEKGILAIHLRGFIEYETIGTNWHRDFWYVWKFSSIGGMFGMSEPDSDEERIARAWWSVEQAEEYEMKPN